ncbi:FIST N-terminal domain-containing protein [Mangrovicoccus algicola]|uniref:FIST C-terminal domain-containing protein n=1 Tax=Mangrovicoccus algicola TaxID=2771008 RepID=A0A8J6YVT2_9RHOB|nr:FIST N-terminal domain-containing protein [Mangrovicoccus algicola]MBE3636983.1 FIST C-terminal domain-containing protein [Mangrovicoccus algicola]
MGNLIADPVARGPGTASPVTVAVSRAARADRAVEEIAAQLCGRDICFVLVFFPAGLDREALAQGLDRALAGVPVFGCSSAGQITPEGYESGALLAIAFPKAHFRCASLLISPLKPLAISRISRDLRRLASRFPRTASWNRLALTFADGLSKQEDMLVATMVTTLEDLPCFGGSAADDHDFAETFVLHGGRVLSDAAVVLLIETDMEFAGLGFDHFLPSHQHMVVTRSIPEERIVAELNGAPAAAEYARQLGLSVDELTPKVFAENPVLVRTNAMYHVRGIQQALPDGSLSFLSAIEDGLLLTLGEGQDLIAKLRAGLDVTDARGRRPDFILGFDCYLRRLELAQKSLTGAASRILAQNRVIGFNTYGEQHCGVHVNQTFVGVAFFGPSWTTLP